MEERGHEACADSSCWSVHSHHRCRGLLSRQPIPVDRGGTSVKALAVDLGGTHATLAVMEGPKVLLSEELSLDRAHGLGPVLPLFASTFKALLSRCGISIADCTGLAFSFC